MNSLNPNLLLAFRYDILWEYLYNARVAMENENQPSTVSPTTPQLTSNRPVTEQTGKRKHPIRRIVIGVVIVLAVIIGFLVATASDINSATKEAEPVSSAFLQAVINDDPEAAYALTSDSFKETTTEATMDGLA